MASRLRGTPRPYAEARPSLSGTAAQGNVLTCNDGVWIPQPITISRQWIRDASTVIAAATGSTYTLVAADQTHTVKCRVTGTNAHDSTVIDTPSSATVSYSK
jgi:hypothetical protein